MTAATPDRYIHDVCPGLSGGRRNTVSRIGAGSAGGAAVGTGTAGGPAVAGIAAGVADDEALLDELAGLVRALASAACS